MDNGHWQRLCNKGVELYEECERKVNPEALSEAIVNFQEALALCPQGHSNRSSTLEWLALVLRIRYEREGDPDDLSFAIAYHREALVLWPIEDPCRYITLNNLAVALKMRYEREGNVDDLSLAIGYHQEDLALCPVGNPDRSSALKNLASALKARFDQEGNVSDLSLAIAYHQEALTLRRVGHPNRASTLNDLAQALETRYKQEGNVDDLVLAVIYRREVLDLRPPGHPLRSSSLCGLASSYWTARNKQEALSAFDWCNDSVAPLLGASSVHPPVEDEERSSNRYNTLGSLTSRIISLLREAAQSRNCSPRDWLGATLSWIQFSKIIDPSSTMEAYTSAFDQLDVALALGQSLEHLQEHLLSDGLMRKTRGLGEEAATWALQQGDLECAVEFLERGRSLLLAQLGRYRAELDDLRRLDSELADRFEDLSRRLDASLVSNSRNNKADSTTNDPYERYRTLSNQWNETVNQIRELPNFDTFLRPLPYQQLRKAAAEGPVIIVIPDEKLSNALIVREDGPIHQIPIPLANSNRLNELSSDILLSLEAGDAEGNRTDGLCLATVKSLWNEVVGPIARVLENDLDVPLGSRVWWCPSSATSFLPLHAAGLYAKGRSGENFPNLYTSSYTPTLHALLRARLRARVGEPRKLLMVTQPAAPGKPPLRHAMEEATVIENIVSPNQDVDMLSAAAGTREAVQRQMESHPWVHFICHGIQAERQPLDSYLLLYDGPLTLRMIIKQNLPNADFAFLSACHSAAGDRVLANEALHLAAAMQFAGFRGVVGTLWEMADENGPPLAETFYGEMIKHGDSRGAAKALSKAIKQLRRM